MIHLAVTLSLTPVKYTLTANKFLIIFFTVDILSKYTTIHNPIPLATCKRIPIQRVVNQGHRKINAETVFNAKSSA